MLALSGEVADGVLPLLFPPERYVEARAAVLAAARAAGRSDDDVDVAACVWCSLAEDAREATAALAEKVAYYGASFSPHVLGALGLEQRDLVPAREALARGDHEGARRLVPAAALRLGIAGSVHDVVERCGALVDLGATHVSFGPPLGPDPAAALRLIGSQVLPALRR
jgi:5,10-methylenetetrahydromethanopterin reductase